MRICSISKVGRTMDAIKTIPIIEQRAIRIREGLTVVSVVELETTIDSGIVTFRHPMFFEARTERLSDRADWDYPTKCFPEKNRRVLIDFTGCPQTLDACPIFAVLINSEWQAVGVWSHFGTLITG